MSAPTPHPPPGLRFARGVVLVVAVLAAVFALAPVGDEDTPWHLLHARLVLEAGATTYPDPVSFTRPGAPYVNQPWLAGLLLLAVHSAAGWAGLSVFTAVFACLSALAVAAVAMRAARGRPAWAAAITALAMAVVAWRFSPRPLMTSLVFLPLALLLADVYARAPRPATVRAAGAGLAALLGLWSVCHGSYVLLPAVVGIVLAGAAREQGLRATLRRGLLLAPLGVFVLAAPGASTHLALIENVAVGDATKHIAEMRPLEWAHLVPSHLNSIVFLDAMLVLGAARSLRAGRVRLDDLGLALLGMALAFTAHRFRDAWAILMVPWVARSAGPSPRPALDRALAVVLALGAPAALWVGRLARDPSHRPGVGFDRAAFAADAADFLDRHRVEGELFNRYDDGGYLSFRLQPAVKIAIDGRTPTLFDDELYFLLRQATRSEAGFDAFEALHPARMALVPRDAPLCRALARRPGWRPVLVDPVRALFFRAEHRPELGRLEALDPCVPLEDLAGLADRARCPALHRDVVRLMDEAPEGAFPLVLAAQLDLGCGGPPGRALGLARDALERADLPEGRAVAARAALAAGALEEAATHAARRVVLARGAPAARLEEAQVLAAAGRPDEALAHADALARELLDATPVELRMLQARLLLAADRPREAAVLARRALWVSGSTRARALYDEAARAAGEGR
jgi:hypothetical protein